MTLPPESRAPPPPNPPLPDLEGFENLSGDSTVTGTDGDNLKDMNLETVATPGGGPYTFTLAGPKRYGIYKIIIYAKTATDVIAGWKVSLIYF